MGLTFVETNERHDRIVQLTLRGVTAREIAHQLGISERTVFRVRGERMIAKPTPRRFTDDELATIESMFDDGASIAEVARTVGRHPATVCRRFKGRGWTVKQAAEWAVEILRARETVPGL